MAILDEIFAQSKKDLEARKARLSLSYLEKLAQKSLDFKRRDPQKLLKALKKSAERYNIIAEIKKASPSEGVIRADFNPVKIAHEYEKNGAAAISVLTEKSRFYGDLEFLQYIAKSVKTPLLQKDFISDEYQILEGVVAGADFILLIARMLEKPRMQGLATLAREFDMEVLFEIHDEKDLDAVANLDPAIVGINNRDLESFKTDLSVSEKLLPKVPYTAVKVVESGIHDKKDLQTLDIMGADAFLIGTYFMRQSDCGGALREFVASKKQDI